MNVRGLRSARSGGVVFSTAAIIMGAVNFTLVEPAVAKPPHYKIEFVGRYGERLKALPKDIIIGNEVERVDRRIYDDVVALSRRFKQIATDCHSLGDHAPDGDHPKGVGCDFVPNARVGGTWEHTRDFAVYMGWQPVGFKGCPDGKSGCIPRLASLSTPARWIGHNGTYCHGDPQHVTGPCGAHLHVSFKSSPTAPGGWPEKVMRFSMFHRGKGTREEPPELVEDAVPSEGTSPNTGQYPIEIPEYVDVTAIAPIDEPADASSETGDVQGSQFSITESMADSVNLSQIKAVVSEYNRIENVNVSSDYALLAPADELDLSAAVLEAGNVEAAESKQGEKLDPNRFTDAELAAIAPVDDFAGGGSESVDPLEVKQRRKRDGVVKRFGTYKVGDHYWYRANYRHIRWVNRLPGSPIVRKRAKEVAWTVNSAAKKYHIEPELLAALIYYESGFQRKIVSSAGALGYTQLMPATARSLGVKDRTNEKQNIFAGARYLRLLLNRFRGYLPTSLKGYNAGPNAPWNAVAGYDSRIMNLRDHLRRTRWTK